MHFTLFMDFFEFLKDKEEMLLQVLACTQNYRFKVCR